MADYIYANPLLVKLCQGLTDSHERVQYMAYTTIHTRGPGCGKGGRSHCCEAVHQRSLLDRFHAETLEDRGQPRRQRPFVGQLALSVRLLHGRQ